MGLSQSFLRYVEEKLSTATGKQETVRLARTISGGDINQAYRLDVDKNSYFIKINDKNSFPALFDLEAKGLLTLGNSTPKIITHGAFENEIFLLLEWIEPGTKNDKKGQQNLGRLVANLHKRTAMKFGLDYDNYIGSIKQKNTQTDRWDQFFIQNRLDYLLKTGTEKGLVSKELRMRFDKLFVRMDSLFPAESPSLLHGDLWGGNYMVNSNSDPILIDPAIYYGHREMDIAMTTLFGGFSPDFYTAYNEDFPLQTGWQKRLSLWNLYPLLVHVNLFGSSYLPQLISALSQYE